MVKKRAKRLALDTHCLSIDAMKGIWEIIEADMKRPMGSSVRMQMLLQSASLKQFIKDRESAGEE